MNRYLKILAVLVSILLLAVLANVGLNIWIEKRLPGIINEENDSPYHIAYKDVDVSLFNSTIVARDIVVVPKDSAGAKQKLGLYAHIETVNVNSFKLWDIIFSNKLRADNIRVSRPNVMLYKEANPAPEKKPKPEKPFSKVIVVSAVMIENGNLKVFKEDKNPMLIVGNINAEVDGILVTDDILDRKIPVGFENYKFTYDSLYYKPNGFYHITTDAFESSNSAIKIKNVAYVPELSRESFVKAIPAEKDLFAIRAAAVEIGKMDWGFNDNKFYFHSGSVILQSAVANIYRPKMPPDDLTKKYLYNKLLRDVPFDLQIDTLAVRNSKLEYEEEKTFEKGAGVLSFSKFNLYATNIASGYGKKKIPDVNINVKCLFMGISPMNVDWRLNPLDKSDGFRIKGNIQNFPAERLTPFVKPYMNVTAKGMLEEVYFDFTGNDNISRGTFGVNYDDLKFTIYRKKEPKKKNKILTTIASIFVKKDTKEKVKKAEIEVERIPEKSFFNLLWRSIAEGLKKILV